MFISINHMYHTKFLLNALFCCSFCFLNSTENLQAQSAGNPKAWVEKSDQYTQLLIDLDKKYSPEYGSAEGLSEYDEQISVPTLANQLAERNEEEKLLTVYTAALQKEKEAPVLQDLHILIDHLKLGFGEMDYELKHKVPFLNAASQIYDGLEILMDEQTASTRRQAAVVRIRKYAGLEPGYQPLTEIFKERVSHQMKTADMIYPSKQRIEVDLSRNASIIEGIALLCKKYNLKGWEEPYEKLKKQVADYDQWTRDQILPKARVDFRLPPEEYALRFEQYGIDIPPAEIAKMAHAAFTEIQNEMKPLAKKSPDSVICHPTIIAA